MTVHSLQNIRNTVS